MERYNFKTPLFFLVCLALLFSGGLRGHCSDFPTKPIIVYSGTSPGSTTYITARAPADEASKDLGVPVAADSKPGAGYTVAATSLANQKPDGYTLHRELSPPRRWTRGT